MKYYNSNKVQVAVHSSKNPEKIYYFPAKATLVVNEDLKNLPEGVRKIVETNSKKNK